MNKFKFLLTTLLFFSFVLSFPGLARAADLNIDCSVSPTTCSKSGLDPLFSNSLDGFWYPGKSITKTVNLKNSGTETREMAIKGTRTSGINILENVIHISIVRGATVIWSGSVADFYGQDKIGMGIFAPGANIDYDFTVYMSLGADDNYQNIETVFDLTLGFWGEPAPTATPAATSASNDSGTVLGAGVSVPVCTDILPGRAPVLTSVVGGVNKVTLTWSPAADPVSYYLIAYGTSSGVYQYGNPNIGGKGTTSYNVTNLSGDTTYYFAVRAGNGCATGPFSNELSVSPGGVVVEGIAEGFLPNVLGSQDQIGENDTKEVKGVSCLDKNYAWWLPLVIQLIVGIVIFKYFGKKQYKIMNRLMIIILGLTIISQAVHGLLGCNCVTGIWCPRYIYLNLAITVLFFIYWIVSYIKKSNSLEDTPINN